MWGTVLRWAYVGGSDKVGLGEGIVKLVLCGGRDKLVLCGGY